MSTQTTHKDTTESNKPATMAKAGQTATEMESRTADALPDRPDRAEGSGHNLSFSDIESLEQLRGELALQAHLLRAELRERFETTEKDWNILSLQLEPLKQATTRMTDDVSAAVRLLFDTVKSGYQDIKKAATSSPASSSH